MAEAQEVMPLQTGVDDRTDEPLYDDVVLGLTKICHSCSKIKGMETFKRKRGPENKPVADCLPCREKNTFARVSINPSEVQCDSADLLQFVHSTLVYELSSSCLSCIYNMVAAHN